VDAFRRLAEELHALGAPADLLDGCRTAAEDEVRHASAMGSLATRFGGALQEPCVAPPRPRTAEELAVENMIEGCVRETYGALVAAYQAERSADAEVRAALAEIAREEADHAGLSWRMHRWLAEQLPPESHGKLAEAQRQAIEGLRRELDGEVEDALREVAGLPDRGTALALLGELEARLWSLAH
jgi:rubrerythrin